MAGITAILVLVVIFAAVAVMASNLSKARRMSNQSADPFLIDPRTGQPVPPDHGLGHHGHGGHHDGGFSGGGHHGGFSGGSSSGGGGDSGGGGHHH